LYHGSELLDKKKNLTLGDSLPILIFVFFLRLEVFFEEEKKQERNMDSVIVVKYA